AKATKEFNATAVASDDIYKISCDVFAPCALGGIINDITINQFQTSIIAGSANNQLAHDYHGKLLHEKDILYATDYVINAGGLIYAANEYFAMSKEHIGKQLNQISKTLLDIFERSKKENTPISAITDSLAKEKLAENIT